MGFQFSRNDPQGLLKVVESHKVLYSTYDFLLEFHSNCGSILLCCYIPCYWAIITIIVHCALIMEYNFVSFRSICFKVWQDFCKFIAYTGLF